jgi:hypothetical protein
MKTENYKLERNGNSGYALFKDLPEDIKTVLENNLKDVKHSFTQETPFFWTDIQGARFAVPIGESETPKWNPLTAACFVGDQIKPSLVARDAKIIEGLAKFKLERDGCGGLSGQAKWETACGQAKTDCLKWAKEAFEYAKRLEAKTNE